MNKILLSSLSIAAALAMISGVAFAYFSDTETSNSNTFAAGTLDLNLDGGNSNVVKFNINNIKPGDTQTGVWTVHNAGSIPGYLDIHNITQTHNPGTSTEPELAVENPDVGTLGSLLNVTLFVDSNNNGVLDGGETTIYSGLLKDMAANYDQNISLAAGGTNYIGMQVNWPSSADDNKGQGDTAQVDMTFELGQTTGQ